MNMATINFTPATLTIPENPKAGDLIATLSIHGEIADGEIFTFALEENFADRFEILGNTLRVKTGGSLFDYEHSTRRFFDLVITATGSLHTKVTPAEIPLDVTDVNEAPTDVMVVSGPISEDTPIGSHVAILIPSDPDEDETFTYSLVDENGAPIDSALFSIDGNRIKLKASFDNAHVGNHKLYVKVVDTDGLSYVEQVTITVTNSAETATGTNKNDKLTGTGDDDILSGLGGNDMIYGLAGNDTINGGAGKDKLYGGEGQDTFVFDTPVKKGHFDQIMDFKASDDTIQISLAALKAFKVKGPKKSDVLSKKGADDKGGDRPDKGSNKSVGFDKLFVKGQKLDKKFFNVGTKLNDTPDGSNDYVFYNKKNGFVYLDVDGSGKGKGIEILKVKPGTILAAADFLFM
jgi:hypothetical protein